MPDLTLILRIRGLRIVVARGSASYACIGRFEVRFSTAYERCRLIPPHLIKCVSGIEQLRAGGEYSAIETWLGKAKMQSPGGSRGHGRLAELNCRQSAVCGHWQSGVGRLPILIAGREGQ